MCFWCFLEANISSWWWYVSREISLVCKGLSQTLEGHFSVTLAKIRFMMVKKRLDRLRNLQVLLASERSICLGYSMVQCTL